MFRDLLISNLVKPNLTMSNSHEQSLDEDVIFLPVSETSPDFLYSETERLALERLLNVGPEAFYSTAGSEHSSCFLSPEEVNDITNWVQDYHLSPLPKEDHWDNGLDSGYEGYSSTYYPAHSDVPAPCLDLGWPERNPWALNDSVRVYTSPPPEGEPSVRELIRQHLQMATQVIAIVTDRLTDAAVIGDLHNAASRGVPVYIILNQRSTHESTIQRLRHPVRPDHSYKETGSFCSRAGRMVVGEMKDKFVMVDLQTVIHGSYSLTWSDAHLHRQLVTVLTGSVLDSFDQEFRILFAASSPIPEPRRTSSSQIANHINSFSDIWLPKHLPLFSDAEINNPPSPPSDGTRKRAPKGAPKGAPKRAPKGAPMGALQDSLYRAEQVLNGSECQQLRAGRQNNPSATVQGRGKCALWTQPKLYSSYLSQNFTQLTLKP
uniref:Scaffolding anchor of CK1 domain-containing protein n=1 Tax=Periophthalmus magnuspinnatus TaxID=409849 RepID=A0A3B4BH79_9GOBI